MWRREFCSHKTYSSDRLLAVLREVLAGEIFPPDQVQNPLCHVFSEFDP